MGLRELQIELSYAGKGEKILKEFLLPSISESVSYDRITSFYTIDSLLAISQGLDFLVQRKGRMRLIIGIHSFPKEMIDATLQKEYLAQQIVQIRQEITQRILSITDSLEKNRLATLAWMIQDGLLEVKAASVRGDGLFHPKTLILKDENNNTIVAVGSPNETGSGLGGNFEQVMIAKSWISSPAVATQEEFFSSLWNGGDDDVIVSDISEETSEMILNALGKPYNKRVEDNHQNSKDRILEVSYRMPANFFVSGDIPSLFVHQERAVLDALSRWPVRVLFADEVGLGKTFEVAASMVFLRKYCGIKRILILTPKSVIRQWQEELRQHFNINAWRFESSKKLFIDSNGHEIIANSKAPLRGRIPDILLMSVQYARGSKAQGSVFTHKGITLPDLLIVDEAHSARESKGIDGNRHKTRTYKMLEEISKKIPHLIFATATPMQKDADEYHAMLKLLGLPSAWRNTRNYQTSLRLIVQGEPDSSDAYCAGVLLRETLDTMHPSIRNLDEEERNVLVELQKADTTDKYEFGCFIQSKWSTLQKVFIKLHPAHLLTIRNTRRSLSEIGYRFPDRNLIEWPINDSYPVQAFYNRVYRYLEDIGFSIEEALSPESKKKIGFIKISYQQRIASSLYSCIRSLEKRQRRVLLLKDWLEANMDNLADIKLTSNLINELGNWNLEKLLSRSHESKLIEPLDADLYILKRSCENEAMALSELIKEAKKLKFELGDLKIIESIKLASNCIADGDAVLIFSKYTDTIDALINEFRHEGLHKNYVFGVYTGQNSYIVDSGIIEQCDKDRIKNALSSRYLKVLFCSDAASEGLNLQAARVLINVDVPWTPSRLEQRIGRIARLGQKADTVDVYNVWYPNSIESRMYHRIQNRLYDTNLAIGEFPEVMALEIRDAVLSGESENEALLNELRSIRHSTQVKALEELWSPEDRKTTTSGLIRRRLLAICEKEFEFSSSGLHNETKRYCLPDNSVVELSDEVGSSECISLKSKPWQFFDYTASEIKIIINSNGIVSAFVHADSQEETLIKHEGIFKLGLNEFLGSEDVLLSYPQMLPNNAFLDLVYAVDCELPERPQLWLN